ncbi:unnamed protein product [Prunus armeniaca]
MGKRQSSPKTEFRASKRCRMPEKGRRSSQRNELYRGAVPFKSTVHGPNSEAEPQICDSPDLPLHALLLNCFRLLSYATPRSSPPINWAPERNENKNAAGPTHCRNYWDFFFFFLLGSIIAR